MLDATLDVYEEIIRIKLRQANQAEDVAAILEEVVVQALREADVLFGKGIPNFLWLLVRRIHDQCRDCQSSRCMVCDARLSVTKGRQCCEFCRQGRQKFVERLLLESGRLS